MSKENVELVRAMVGAFNRRDLAAMREMFDPEIEWTPGGPAAVEHDVYRGRDPVLDGFAATWEAWEVFRLSEHEVRDFGESAVWLGRAQLRGGTSHVELDQEFAVHFRIDAGVLVRIHGFADWERALEHAGLQS